jgi:hypothetical protein
MSLRAQACVAVVVACACVPVAFAATSKAKPAAPTPELRAFVNESCVVADEPWLVPAEKLGDDQTSRAGPLIVLAVSKLAEVLVSHTVKATAGRISADAARKDTHYAFARDTNLYRVDFTPQPQLVLNGRLGCITLVAATFAATPGCQVQYQPKEPADGFRGKPEGQWQATRSDTSLANVLRRSDICVEDAPHAVFEARFEFSADGSAWRLINAGYQIDHLLTTKSARDERNVFYTLEVLQPSGTALRGESLTKGIVALGNVRSGARGDEEGGKGAWLRVPTLNADARRTYEQRTALVNETWSEIGALERALKRNQSVSAELGTRKATAKGELLKGLTAEEARLAIQQVTIEAELKARREEYASLPHQSLEFMPVAIEVGLTETRSEQPALLALSEVMKQSSGFIGGAAGQLANVSRSIDLEAPTVRKAPSTAAASSTLGAARDAWQEARLAQKLATTAEERTRAEADLAKARATYAARRRDAGLSEELPP